MGRPIYKGNTHTHSNMNVSAVPLGRIIPHFVIAIAYKRVYTISTIDALSSYIIHETTKTGNLTFCFHVKLNPEYDLFSLAAIQVYSDMGSILISDS